MSRLVDRPINVVVCLTAALVVPGGVAWWAMASAKAPAKTELVAEGHKLFVHEWTEADPLSGGGDGLGPMLNANSCVACHLQGGVGGAGPRRHNVTVFEVLPNRRDESLSGGVVHAFATDPRLQQSNEQIKRLNPVIPDSTRVVGGCTIRIQDFDPVVFADINTPALFGVGLIDDLPASRIKWKRRMRMLNKMRHEFALDFNTPGVGRPRTLPDGSLGKFGWKGQFATLEDFVATACAVELGLTNPLRSQDAADSYAPDNDAKADMTRRQLDSLIEFCRALPRPEQVLPDDPAECECVVRGEKLFTEIGCAECHTPSLYGIHRIYSDFLLHSIEHPDNAGYREEIEVPLPDDHPRLNEWQTPPLWGVADSAPYFHDGGSATLQDAILRHAGSAAGVTKRYDELREPDRDALLQFLGTLRAPQKFVSTLF